MMLRALGHPLTVFTLALALFAAVAPAGAAPEPGWIPLGPDAGQAVRSVTVQAGEPSRLYAAGVSGVFRTRGGARWDLLNAGTLPLGETGTLDSTPGPEGAVYLVSGGGDSVFVQPEELPDPAGDTGRIFTSDDGGETWRVVKEEAGLLAVSAVDPSRLFLMTARGLETSDDGGETWAPVASELLQDVFELFAPRVTTLTMAPSDPDTVYVVLELSGDKGFPDRIRVLRSRDAGASWQELDGPDLSSVSAGDLAIDPADPETLYLDLSKGVFRSGDGGATWEQRSEGLPSFETNSGRETIYPVDKLVVDPDRPQTLYAAARPSGGTPGGVYRSTDAGLSWAPAGDGLPLPLTIHDLALDPADSRTLYAATPKGVFRSSDGGDHWSPTAGELPTPVASVALDPTAPATVFTGTDDGRLFASDDGGEPWRRTGEELPTRGPITVLTVARGDPSTLFLHGGSGPLGRSTDGGETWAAIGSPPAGGEFADLVEVLVDPRDTNRVLGVIRDAGGVFVSPDFGVHWERRLTGRMEVLVRSPSEPDVLYAGAETRDSGPDRARGVCRSGDAGASWECSADGLTEGRRVTALAVDPRDSSVVLAALLAGGRSREPALPLLRRSLDGGATWAPVEPGLPGEGAVSDLVVDPRNPEILWAAKDPGGVFRSTDGGDSWTAVHRGLTHLGIRDLGFDPSGRVLLAATGNGVFRHSTAAGPAPPAELAWVRDAAVPGFRVKARIHQGSGQTLPARHEPACIPETLCFLGALPDRSELFVRIVGPKPNGRLWPTLVKFSTSRIEVWIQQLSTGELRYYELRGASPGFDELPGLFDRTGFLLDSDQR